MRPTTTGAAPAILGGAPTPYLTRIAIELYVQHQEVNAGLPFFGHESYRLRTGQRAIEDALAGDEAASVLAEYLTGLSVEEMAWREDADLDALIGEEVDDSGATRLEEHADRFVDDLRAVLDLYRVTTFTTDEPDRDYELGVLADTGELALFDAAHLTARHPYKGGGFTCTN